MVRDFGSGTRGFIGGDVNEAVCLLPGTELAFDAPICTTSFGFFVRKNNQRKHDTAIFRQVDKEQPYTHHDALELPDGKVIKLTTLEAGQQATVLQLPAAAQSAEEAEAGRLLEAID